MYDATISRTANTVLAAPNGKNGIATFRTLDEKATRVSLYGQCQTSSYRTSVIALCYAPTTTTSTMRSYSTGQISFTRNNGLYAAPFLDISMVASYGGIGNVLVRMLYTAGFSDITPCTFTYNGVLYGGIRFKVSDAETQYVTFVGETTFPIFALDIYDSNTKTVLNSEVYNSISTSMIGIASGWYDAGHTVYTSAHTIPAANGGTGHDFSNIPAGAIIRNSADDTGLWYTQTKSGALYATANDVNPTFGTLPIAQGGTGATTASAALSNLGGMSMQLIWQDSLDGGVAFSAQRINFGVSYDGFFIICRHQTINNTNHVSSGFVARRDGYETTFTIADNKLGGYRQCIVTNSYIRFQDAYNAGGSKNNEYLVPYKIFGIKGVL